MSTRILAGQAQEALGQIHAKLRMSTEPERFAWGAMTIRERRQWASDAGITGIWVAPLTWHELTPGTREKLVRFARAIVTEE